MSKITRFAAHSILVLAITLMASSLYAGHDDRHNDGESGNPLVEEMLILDTVFRDVVSGVSLGDGEAVHGALESMHGTMERTHRGVHAGQVRIPRNADRLEEFVQMDKAFHEKLELLAHAAHEGDQSMMLNLTQTLLDGCVQCHSIYR